MKPTIRIVFIACLAALAFSCQIAISFLPNVELVSLLFIIYSFSLRKRDLLMVVFIFSLLEGIMWGFGDWVIGYLWIWPILCILAQMFKPIIKENANYWALFSAVWGILFGILFSIQDSIIYSFNAGLAYYLNGLVFDIIHSVSNYIITLLLFTPLTQRFSKLYDRLTNTYGNNN